MFDGLIVDQFHSFRALLGPLTPHPMPDARRIRKPRQLRGKITAGTADLDSFKSHLADFIEDYGWSLTYESLQPRGDYGPLHDYCFGLVETIN